MKSAIRSSSRLAAEQAPTDMQSLNDEGSAASATLESLAQLHRRIEQAALSDNWSMVEALMAERNELLTLFDGKDRAAALEAARDSTDQILDLARSARLEVAGELAKLQKGRKATDIYRAHR